MQFFHILNYFVSTYLFLHKKIFTLDTHLKDSKKIVE